MARMGTCLILNGRAEEAAEFYVSVFANSRILEVSRWGETGPGVPGEVLVVEFELDGRPFTALNTGPDTPFTMALSLEVYFDTQEELDGAWTALTRDGGREDQCGWLADKYGVSWQLIPARLNELLNGPDRAGADRAMAAMLEMVKLDMAGLQAAYDGERLDRGVS